MDIEFDYANASKSPEGVPLELLDLRRREAIEERPSRPWVVLVTGLNGVRKTTAPYEPWFEDTLADSAGP